MTTTTDTRVNDLIINKMSKAQFDALPEKSPTELYIVEGDSNIIYAEQAIELPTADESNLGRIYQYVGATNQNYTNGYFYKCTSGGQAHVEFTPRTGVQTVISVSTSDFYNFLEDKCEGRNFTAADVTGGMIGYYSADRYSFSMDTADPNKWASLSFTIAELEAAGFTFNPYLGAQQGVDYTCGISGYVWTRVDVQPTVDPLPDQTGNAGKFLTTDGTNASWDEPIVATFRTWGANE